jgi:cation:H+ antiporter
LLVEHCLIVARGFAVSEAVISLTIIAAGTSMPELATSVVAALRKQPDIAIGNVVGSNIFNVLGILGLSSLVQPLHSQGIRDADLYWMVGLSVLLLPLMARGLKLRRIDGALLLSGYGVYLWLLWPK